MAEKETSRTDPVERYRERAGAFAAQAAREARRSRALSHARLLVFLLALLALASAAGAPPGVTRSILMIAGLLGMGVFATLALRHERVKHDQRRLDALRRVNEEGPRRVARDWNAIPERDALVAGPDHPYARDLDVFGHASLFRLLGPIGTVAGVQRVCEWLLAPAEPSEIRARQAAVSELAELADLRDAMAAQRLLHRRSTAAELRRFLDWSVSLPSLSRSRALRAAVYILPPIAMVLLLLRLVGVLDGALPFLPLLITAAMTVAYAPRLRDTLQRAASSEGPLRHAAAAFALLRDANLSAPLLAGLRGRLEGSRGGEAQHAARTLERLTHMAELRYSPMLHFAVQLLTLWDFHLALRLERWRVRNGHRAHDWLDALASIEALAALATLRHDNPAWVFPDISEGDPPVLEARLLGHPLIPPDRRVDNDVRVGPPGTFLFVTGSNMSGKSTLLRAVGLNTVLAQMGGPVCAAAMELQSLRVHTSMRLQDSLEQGISFFMAELLRLRSVIDAAREPAAGTLLYLLDEVLQGTNTAERQVAARRIIRELLALRAIGAVTSHDLSLADTADLNSACVAVHFSETVRREDGAPRMTFDYRLRPEVATSVNALTLMEMIGLAPGDHDLVPGGREQRGG